MVLPGARAADETALPLPIGQSRPMTRVVRFSTVLEPELLHRVERRELSKIVLSRDCSGVSK
jgi:hypothetical protein